MTALRHVVSELEVEDAVALSRGLTSGSVDVAVSSSDLSSVPAQVLEARRTSGSDAREQTEVTSSGSESVSGPHDDLLGTSVRSGNNSSVGSARGGLVEGPAEVTRATQVVSDDVNKGVDGHEHISDVEAGSETVTSTRQDTQVLLAAEVVEEEVDRVRLEELVLRSSDNVSGLSSEPVVEDDGIDQSGQSVELGLVEVVQATSKELQDQVRIRSDDALTLVTYVIGKSPSPTKLTIISIINQISQL